MPCICSVFWEFFVCAVRCWCCCSRFPVCPMLFAVMCVCACVQNIYKCFSHFSVGLTFRNFVPKLHLAISAHSHPKCRMNGKDNKSVHAHREILVFLPYSCCLFRSFSLSHVFLSAHPLHRCLSTDSMSPSLSFAHRNANKFFDSSGSCTNSIEAFAVGTRAGACVRQTKRQWYFQSITTHKLINLSLLYDGFSASFFLSPPYLFICLCSFRLGWCASKNP